MHVVRRPTDDHADPFLVEEHDETVEAGRPPTRQSAAGHHRVVVEWMGSKVTTLDDLLPLWPRAVIVGMCPSPSSVADGHHHQDQAGRRVWSRLRRCGVLPDDDSRWEDDVAVAAGIGLAAVVPRPVRSAEELGEREVEQGVARLRQRMAAARPHAIVFVDAATASLVLGTSASAGWMDGSTFAGADVFVMPGAADSRARTDAALDDLVARLRR